MTMPDDVRPAAGFVEDLALRVSARVREHGETDERIPALHFSMVEKPTKVTNCFYSLSVALILRGRKVLSIHDQRAEYGAGDMIVTSIDLPTSFEIHGASPESPFVSLSLRLDPSILAEQLLSESVDSRSPVEPFVVAAAPLDLLEDFERLLRLLDRPGQIAVRSPLLIRDIHYLVLTGVSSQCLRALYAPGAAGQRIRRAVRKLRENFRERLRIEDLAATAGMAPSTFMRHFKALTSLSPIQFQKRLRLYEAQQFLLRGEGDVNSAAFAVGYESLQQFSRDYKRQFGETPGLSTRRRREKMRGR